MSSILPKEVAAFAKQFGLEMSGLEPEAEQIWKHLEKLSTESPVEYERFVAEQMQAAKEDQQSTSKNKKKDSSRTFRPNGRCLFLHDPY
jgi:hypothetical protein